VNESEKDRLDKIFKALQGHPVLTVSDMERFPDKGGMIQLFMQKRKVRFAIDPETAAQAGLKISSHLLKLAVIK